MSKPEKRGGNKISIGSQLTFTTDPQEQQALTSTYIQTIDRFRIENPFSLSRVPITELAADSFKIRRNRLVNLVSDREFMAVGCCYECYA